MSATNVVIPRIFGGALILGPVAPPRVLKITFANVSHGYGSSPYGSWAYGIGQYYGLYERINAVFASPVDHINATFTEVAMTTPYTTIDSSATVTDQNGTLISNLAVYTLSVVYQDGTTAAPSVTNEGSGIYTASYNTKGPGTLTELWSFTDVSGSIAQDQRTLVIAY